MHLIILLRDGILTWFSKQIQHSPSGPGPKGNEALLSTEGLITLFEAVVVLATLLSTAEAALDPVRPLCAVVTLLFLCGGRSTVKSIKSLVTLLTLLPPLALFVEELGEGRAMDVLTEARGGTVDTGVVLRGTLATAPERVEVTPLRLEKTVERLDELDCVGRVEEMPGKEEDILLLMYED